MDSYNIANDDGRAEIYDIMKSHIIAVVNKYAGLDTQLWVSIEANYGNEAYHIKDKISEIRNLPALKFYSDSNGYATGCITKQKSKFVAASWLNNHMNSGNLFFERNFIRIHCIGVAADMSQSEMKTKLMKQLHCVRIVRRVNPFGKLSDPIVMCKFSHNRNVMIDSDDLFMALLISIYCFNHLLQTRLGYSIQFSV